MAAPQPPRPPPTRDEVRAAFTDAELAASIRDHAAEMTKLIEEAASRGIRVQVEWASIQRSHRIPAKRAELGAGFNVQHEIAIEKVTSL